MHVGIYSKEELKKDMNMLIKNWVFEILVIVLLTIFVVSGILIVHSTFKIDTNSEIKPVEKPKHEKGRITPMPSEGLKTIDLRRIDVRLCPECKQETMVKTGLVFKCRECKAEYDWNEL